MILAPPVFLVVILPKKWFFDGFISRSVIMVLIGLAYMMYLADQFHGMESYPSAALNLAPVILLAILLAVFLVGKISFLRRLIDGFADRATVLLYISIPLSLVCLLVVLVQLII